VNWLWTGIALVDFRPGSGRELVSTVAGLTLDHRVQSSDSGPPPSLLGPPRGSGVNRSQQLICPGQDTFGLPGHTQSGPARCSIWGDMTQKGPPVYFIETVGGPSMSERLHSSHVRMARSPPPPNQRGVTTPVIAMLFAFVEITAG